MNRDANLPRGRLAAEVLELGEALFDSLIAAATAPPAVNTAEPFPEQAVRAAAEQFFTALRLLLGQDEDAGAAAGL